MNVSKRNPTSHPWLKYLARPHQQCACTRGRLKVMLEQDYVAEQHRHDGTPSDTALEPSGTPASRIMSASTPDETGALELARNIIGEIIVPEIEKEVNEGDPILGDIAVSIWTHGICLWIYPGTVRELPSRSTRPCLPNSKKTVLRESMESSWKYC